MSNSPVSGLSRNLGLLGLTATGICSMLGASIYVVPFMIQRNVPGIGPYVLPAFLFAALPAILAALAYAMLSSAMPRAGGSYVYASRGLHPYLGFIASFAQWFGLSIAIGVISYVLVPFFRDISETLGWQEVASALDTGWVRLTVAIGLLWSFTGVNMLGLSFYERTLIPLMFLMFVLGLIVVVAGYAFDHEDFTKGLLAQEGKILNNSLSGDFNIGTFLAASAVLFSSFIGFDSIAQAGGEAKKPGKLLPQAILLAILTVGAFYFLFTSAVYHAVPWSYVAEAAREGDISAPGLFRFLLPPFWTILIMAGATVALLNDLPAMLLSVSRLVFAWSADGVFPQKIAVIHSASHTPRRALAFSALMATAGILGSHFAGDFFLGVDIMVTSMLVNFLLMCATLLALPVRNPGLAREIKVIRNRRLQRVIALLGMLFLSGFLLIHISKDLRAQAPEWYFHATPVWILVMTLGSVIYFWQIRALKRKGVDTRGLFGSLPEN